MFNLNLVDMSKIAIGGYTNEYGQYVRESVGSYSGQGFKVLSKDYTPSLSI